MNPVKLEKGLLTVIVAVYQVRQYLDQCIQSIVGQSYRKLQLILVDDGSQDGSGELCDQWAARDKRIQVVHQKNGGLSAARNTGVRYARGEALCFVDADDWIAPDYLETLYRNMKAADADVSCCSFLEMWEETEACQYTAKQSNSNIFSKIKNRKDKSLSKIEGKNVLNEIDQRNIAREHTAETEQEHEIVSAKRGRTGIVEESAVYEKMSETTLWKLLTEVGADCASTWLIVAWNKLIRTEIAGTLSFPKGKWHEDEFYIHRLLNKTCKVVKTDDILYYYRRRKDSISGSDRQRDERHLAILEAFQERLRYCRRQGNPEIYQMMVNAYRQTIIIQYHAFRKTEQTGFLRKVYLKSLWDYPLYPVKKWRLFRSYMIFLLSPGLFYKIYW